MSAGNARDSHLPEVVQRDYFPIAVPRDGEGMQAVEHDWNQGPWAGYKQQDGYASVPQEPTTEKEVAHRKSSFSRRSWVIIGIVLLIVVILAVGLGAGLGVGLNSGSGKSTSEAAQPSGTPASAITSTITTTSTGTSSTSTPATSTCSGVTSGETGIACVSCNQTDSNNGGYVVDTGSSTTTFNELCNIDMPNRSPVYNATTDEASTTRNLADIDAVLSYSFTDCMDQCAKYNQQHGTGSDQNPCKAVTYGANLTAAIVEQDSQGNCYLKNARGYGIFDSSGLVMSGYIVSS